MNIVDTEQEALRDVQNSDMTESSKFCPMTRKQCTMNCASFNPAQLRELGKDKFYCSEEDKGKWQWYPAGCTNMIVTGSLQVDNSC